MKRVLLTFTISCFLSVAAMSQEHKISVQKFEPPVYPQIAKQARVMGLVQVELDVNGDGTVKEVRIAKGHPLFTDSVVKSLRTWRFACNGCKFGQRYLHHMTVSFEFSDEMDATDTRIRYEFPDLVHVITGSPVVIITISDLLSRVDASVGRVVFFQV